MKYANITMEKKYQDEGNLGDYVQFIAIDYLYKLMGVSETEIIRIEYWDLIDYDGEECILPINFFYFNPSKDGRPFILSPKIHPVYLGLHLPGNISDVQGRYFYDNKPIGCRDENTYKLLMSSFEKARFSSTDTIARHLNMRCDDIYLQGCITACFPKRSNGIYEEIYLIDIPNSIEDMLPKEITKNAKKMTQLLYDKLEEEVNRKGVKTAQEYVENRLELYRNTAKLIITSRMHCAVPCLAMGIPVVFIVPAISPRYMWMEKLIRIYTYDEIDIIDWNISPIEYEEYKEILIKNAMSRIKGKNNKLLISKVHDWYMARDKKECYSGYGIGLLYKYADLNWEKNDKIEYILWGITATTEEVYSWINKNYPNAVLMGVIDEYRDLIFHGKETMRSSCVEKYSNCYFVGTGTSASIAMMKLLKSYGKEWENRGIPLIL